MNHHQPRRGFADFVALVILSILLTLIALFVISVVMWSHKLGLVTYGLLTAVCIVSSARAAPRARKSKSQRDAVSAVLWLAATMILVFAGVYFAIYKNSPNQYQYSEVAVQRDAIDAPLDIRDQLAEDADLVVSLVALTTFQPSNDPDLSRTEIEFPIADDITFRRYTYKIITPELDEIEATGVAFVLGEQPMKLDTGMSFGTDPYRGFNGKMRSVENLEELRGVATEYLDVVLEAREKRLSELRDRLSGTVKLNIWDFIYCSVAAFTTLGTGDIVPASTLTRLVVALEALVALLIGGFGVELFFENLKAHTRHSAGARSGGNA